MGKRTISVQQCVKALCVTHGHQQSAPTEQKRTFPGAI